ncbi:hypothetical protein ID0047_03390 [Helicobacter pylori]
MKKSFKKLGFVSLAASSVLLGSMNATDLETYAALQKPSHVFGNYAETKKDKDSKDTNSDKDKGNSGGTLTQQDQAQTTASSDSTQAKTLESTASTDNTTAATDETYTKSSDSAVSGAAQKVETDNTAVQTAEQALKSTVEKVQADANAIDFNETTFTQDQAAEQTAEKAYNRLRVSSLLMKRAWKQRYKIRRKHQPHQPHQLKRSQNTPLAHQPQAVAVWKVSWLKTPLRLIILRA